MHFLMSPATTDLSSLFRGSEEKLDWSLMSDIIVDWLTLLPNMLNSTHEKASPRGSILDMKKHHLEGLKINAMYGFGWRLTLCAYMAESNVGLGRCLLCSRCLLTGVKWKHTSGVDAVGDIGVLDGCLCTSGKLGASSSCDALDCRIWNWWEFCLQPILI